MYTSHDFAALNASAAAGDAEAQLLLARASIVQAQGAPSLAEGERLLAAACDQQFPAALMFRAALTVRGVGREKDLDAAYALVAKAASLGNVSARGQLRVLGERSLDKKPWLKPIHLELAAESPRIYVVEDFIPANVCDWLVQRANKKGLTSAVVNTPDGRKGVHADRTNSMTGFLQTESDLVVQLVSRRIARATGTPQENHEALAIFKYTRGQQYRPHYDFVEPGTREAENYADELAAVGMRMATVLVYLNEGYEGGETSFPRIKWSFKGRKGDALIFWSLSEDGKPDRNSLHAGTPVIKGEKWLLSQWIRQKPYPLS